MSKQTSLFQYKFTCTSRKQNRSNSNSDKQTALSPPDSSHWDEKFKWFTTKFPFELRPEVQLFPANHGNHVFLSEFYQPDGSRLSSIETVNLPHYNQSTWACTLSSLDRLYNYLTSTSQPSIDRLVTELASYSQSFRNCDGDLPNIRLLTTESPFSHSFLQSILPRVITLAKRIDVLFPFGLPCLVRNGNIWAITLSEEQVGCLLSNVFLGTFVGRDRTICSDCHEPSHFPSIDCKRLYCNVSTQAVQKLKCFFNYLDRITSNNVARPFKQITYVRTRSSEFDFSTCDMPFTRNICIVSSSTLIDQCVGCIQLDFANKNLGGGIFGRGAVQEEILMCRHPEMIACRIFASTLSDDEAFHVIGSECFNQIDGYSTTFRWIGDYNDTTPRDQYCRLRSNICCIDALQIYSKMDNFRKSKIDRELIKALTGFIASPYQNNFFNVIATGFWGCGAFGGNKEMKALIQLIACMVAGRQMVFSTFQDDEFAQRMEQVIALLQEKSLTVSTIYHLLIEVEPYSSVFDQIINKFR